MSRETRYQQVRSHLAYLKLSAAAEALPGQLDQALMTKATHTEFLERLLVIEVGASKAAATPGRSGSPTSRHRGDSPTSTTPPNRRRIQP